MTTTGCSFCKTPLEDDLILREDKHRDTALCPSCFVVFTGNDEFDFQTLFTELDCDHLEKLNTYRNNFTPNDDIKQLIRHWSNMNFIKCFFCNDPPYQRIQHSPACMECYMKYLEFAKKDEYQDILSQLDTEAKCEVERAMSSYPPCTTQPLWICAQLYGGYDS